MGPHPIGGRGDSIYRGAPNGQPHITGRPDRVYVWLPQIVKFYPMVINALFHHVIRNYILIIPIYNLFRHIGLLSTDAHCRFAKILDSFTIHTSHIDTAIYPECF